MSETGKEYKKKPEIVYENDWIIAVVHNGHMVWYIIIMAVGHL